MTDHQCAKAFGVSQCAAVNLGIGDHVIAVRKCDGPRIQKEPDLCHLAAIAPFGQRGHVANVDLCISLRTTRDEFERFRGINRSCGVRAGDNSGHATGRSGTACGAVGFFMTFAGFADLHAHVDDAGREA